MLDSFYISFFNISKKKLSKKAIPLALYYITLCEIAFYSLLAIFFAAFANQLNVGKISLQNAVILTILCVLFIWFKNYMRYNGKRRTILNANKSKKSKIQPWKLVVFPFACVILSIILYQAI